METSLSSRQVSNETRLRSRLADRISASRRRLVGFLTRQPSDRTVPNVATPVPISPQTPRASSKICLCGNPRQTEPSTHELPKYVYSQLSAESAFRIFSVSSGLEGEPIQGSIREVLLPAHNPEEGFTALSYAWFNAVSPPVKSPPPVERANAFAWETVQKPHTIVVDNVSRMGVTCSVYSALLRLRSATSELRIFVDAICIDQGSSIESLRERGNQVRKMGDIYSSARTVFIDLGDQDDGAIETLSQIREISALEHTSWDLRNITATEFLRIVPPPLLEDLGTLRSQHSLIALCARRWWSRLWTLPEFLLAVQAKFLVNREVVDRDVMMKGLDRIWTYQTALSYKLILQGHGEVSNEMALQFDRYCRYPCVDLTYLSRMKSSKPDFFSSGFEPVDLLQLMARTRILECAIPHDHLYGLLGLVRYKDRGFISVDYSLGYDSALVMFSTYVIQQGGLHMLLPQISSQPFGSPTWVLDPMNRNSTDTYDQMAITRVLQNAPRASGRETKKVSFDETGRRLQVESVVFGTISAVTEPLASFTDGSAGDFASWCTNGKALFSRHSVHAAGATSDDFWATMCVGGRFEQEKLVLDQLLENAHTFDNVYLQNGSGDLSQALEFSQHASPYCRGRRFAMTKEGNPALVPSSAQPGDEVAVFLGCPVPFVIRPTPRGTNRFIGCAYVHGFMDGEALQSEKLYRETVVLE